jgi:hypothetical protein
MPLAERKQSARAAVVYPCVAAASGAKFFNRQGVSDEAFGDVVD